MRTIVLTPNSSKSTTTTESNQSENRDRYYFPGCRKDENCDCEICIASINATLDLMPQSINRSSLTKLSSSKSMISRSPVSFNTSSADISTPKGSAPTRPISVFPTLYTAARGSFNKKKRRKREWGYEVVKVWLVLGLNMVFAAEYGISWMISGVLKPKLSPDFVKNLGEKSLVLKDLNSRMSFLENELQGVVNKGVSNCSSVDSVWKISQDGLLLNSRCTLYKSIKEEVSIWGWPLQTDGLLTAECSPRSFTIVSGKVSEWLNGEAKYLIRQVNSSWTQRKWGASAVRFDPNTWLLEYRQSFLMQNPRLVSEAVKFLKFRLAREFEKMKQQFWLLSAFCSQYADFTGGRNPVPT
ncbi:C-8 sterol isomerase [Abeliophyllum distichum]|uniref:C-8 sterol isomerase n=1 Tax=Abeliophyllum distichum TaxID=126358 RepID=A0ABD1Q170_9LAMI